MFLILKEIKFLLLGCATLSLQCLSTKSTILRQLIITTYDTLRRNALITDLIRLSKMLGFETECFDGDQWFLKRGKTFFSSDLSGCVGYLLGYIQCAAVAA